MSATLCSFDRDFFHDRFAYDETFGMLLRRKTLAHNARAGQYIGTFDGKGYLHVNILDKFVRVHRIIFFMLRGETPAEVDHIDGCRVNNLIENLRGANRQQNAGNSRACSNNTSGFKGVSLNRHSGQYHAQIKINGKQTYLGRSHDPRVAAALYDRAALAHFGEFARLNDAA